MEKLIVEYSVSDGFTYFATNTVPVLFSSKEEFIILFAEKLLAQKKEFEHFNQKHTDLIEQRFTILKKLSNLNDKKKSSKENLQLIEESQQLNKSIIDLYDNKVSPLTSMKIGGQNFHLDNFFSEGEVCLPQVFTIEEWFANIDSIEQ